MSSRFILMVCAIFVVSGSCRQRTKTIEANPNVVEVSQGEFPVRVSVVRDGRTSCIGFRATPEERLEELYLVYRQRPEVGGDVYLNESWNVPGASPLSSKKALAYFIEVEDLLKKHFGVSEFEKIVSETEELNKLTIDKLKEKYADPAFADRFVASNAIQLISEFRGYLTSNADK